MPEKLRAESESMPARRIKVQRHGGTGIEHRLGITAGVQRRDRGIIGSGGNECRRSGSIDAQQRRTPFGFKPVHLAAEKPQHRRPVGQLLLHAYDRIEKHLKIGTGLFWLRNSQLRSEITADRRAEDSAWKCRTTLPQKHPRLTDILQRAFGTSFGQTVFHDSGGEPVLHKPQGGGSPLLIGIDLVETAAWEEQKRGTRQTVGFEKRNGAVWQRLDCRDGLLTDKRCRRLATAGGKGDFRQFHLHFPRHQCSDMKPACPL